MNTQIIIPIIQFIVAILLVASILLQQRGSGLSGVFGGDSSVYRTKRGAEKTLFYITIILSVLFLGTGILRLFI